MAEKLLDKASYSIIRTNPKLTGNVKVVSDGTDIYLESFSANTRLSSQRYKSFKVDGTSTYDQDVFRFFKSGKFPIDSAYEVFQEYEDTSVLSSYGNQYEMFYSAGTRSIASETYSQSMGTLAPLWLNEQIPNYFVIFRLDNPAAVNNFDATTENAGSVNAQTSAAFSKNVLENCTAIKTFDLSESTTLGSYIRNYRNQEEFPEVPLTVSWRKDEPILWNGISYKSGGFTSSGSYAYSDLVGKDATIMQNEFFFTQGFQNNKILLANLLNLEFLFDDPYADDYSINRYFGMYVNDVEEGAFDLSGIGFYKNTEKSQLPEIKTITEVSQYLNKPFEMSNESGILLFLDPGKTTTVTGLPTPARVNEVESVFYVKDKEDDFHTIKKGSLWGTDQLRLFDKKIDISLLTGYKQPDTFANASILSRQGLAQMSMKIIDNTDAVVVDSGSAIVTVLGGGVQTYAAGVNINLVGMEEDILVGYTVTTQMPTSTIPADTTVTSIIYDFSVFPGHPLPTAIIVLNNGVTLDDLTPLQFQSPNPTVNLVEEGSTISFYDDLTLTGIIAANGTLAPTPGTSFETFFNPNGTPQEVAQAIVNAINFIDDNDRYFTATINDDTVYVMSRFGGTRFNQLNFKMDIAFPEQFQQIQTSPKTSMALPAKHFIGGNNTKNALLKVEAGDQDRFIKGNFVQTTGGYATIEGWSPYTDEPIFNGVNKQIGYTDIDKYVVITCDDDQIMVTRANQVALYSDYRPSFGRFSFFDVRDFDVDFYSTLYSQEGELSYEETEYNQYTLGPGGDKIYSGISSTPEIRKFYDTGGFFNLVGLLKPSTPEDVVQDYISSEYIRLEENFLTSQATASRIIPYINKWSWVNDGKDVRNHPYRLDLSEAFGLNNFAPSKWDRGQVASGYTHEWYYLSEFPNYFTQSAIESSWSYIDTAPVDSTPANPIAGTPYIPGTFQRIDKNYFDDYFIIERFTTGGISEIDRQLRYGRFSGGDDKNFAETFLRGVRIVAKPKAIGTEKSDFNARALSYVTNGNFNDYRFSVMLVPNLPNKPETEIKFIKNEKWKTVVLLISLKFDDPCLNSGGNLIDRTSLYSLESKYVVDGTCAPVDPLQYLNGTMQGSLSFNSSAYDPITGYYIIQGIPDQYGNPTKFLDDITVGLDGSYSDIQFTTAGPAATYLISAIQNIISDTQLVAAIITRNGVPWTLPNPTPSNYILERTNYITIQGGYGAYQNRLNNVGFAEIFDAVNQGNPDVIYETIDSDGNQVLNSDGSLSQTFGIQLRAQEDILKSVYVGVLPDPAKPTTFNLTDIIGYDLSLQQTPRITPIGRHAGYYQPTALSILSFRDPYMNIDFDAGDTGSGITGGTAPLDEAYKLKVLELCKWKNTQFNSSYVDFGQLQNFFYHKVNEQDPSTILELSAESAFPSLYPLINEWGIEYKDFYAFSSNWEPSYFIKSIDKNQIEDVIGTRSMKEKKSFFGSKYLKVPEEIILDTFTPSPFEKAAIKQPSLVSGTFMHLDTPSVTVSRNIIQSSGTQNIQQTINVPSTPSIAFYLFNQKRLTEYLFTPIKVQFEKYIRDLYGWGNLETLDDDVNRYIEENILKLYKIGKIELYTLAERLDQPNTYITAKLTNAEKITSGLSVDGNVSSKTLNTNPFDLRLIYNKRTGFTESFGFSVTIVKK